MPIKTVHSGIEMLTEFDLVDSKPPVIVACYTEMRARGVSEAYCSDLESWLGPAHPAFVRDNDLGSRRKRIGRAFEQDVQIDNLIMYKTNKPAKFGKSRKATLINLCPGRLTLPRPVPRDPYEPVRNGPWDRMGAEAYAPRPDEHPRATMDLSLIRRIEALEREIAELKARPADGPSSTDAIVLGGVTPERFKELVRDLLWLLGHVEEKDGAVAPSKAAKRKALAQQGEDE